MKQILEKLWMVIEKMALWCLRLLFKLLKKELTSEGEEAFLQFVKFGMVGVTNSVLSYLINIAVLLVLKPANVRWDYIAGNVISFLLSVLWSFYWNNKYVFTKNEGETRNLWRALLRAYASYGFTGLILNNILSFIWIDLFGISKYVAPMINLIVSVPINFIMNKFWAFKAE